MINVTLADKILLGEHFKRSFTTQIPRVNIHCQNLDNKKIVTIVYIAVYIS